MQNRESVSWVKYLAYGSTIASSFIGLEVGGYFFGGFLDSHFKTGSIFTLIMMIAGVICGMGNIALLFIKFSKVKK